MIREITIYKPGVEVVWSIGSKGAYNGHVYEIKVNGDYVQIFFTNDIVLRYHGFPHNVLWSKNPLESFVEKPEKVEEFERIMDEAF